MPKVLFPEQRDKFGDFAVPLILAHEWGHAIQARSNFTARTVTRELQADCFAGAWSKHAQDDKVFDVTSADLDGALAGILDVRDTPGKLKFDRGRPRQRVRPRRCVSGRLRQRVGQVQGLPRRRPDRARASVQQRRGGGERRRRALRLDRQRRPVRPRGLLDPGVSRVDRWAGLASACGHRGIQSRQPADVRRPVNCRTTRCSIVCQTITWAGTTSA